MPHDLFGDALVQQPRSPLRRLLAVVSIALHAVLVTVIVTAQVLAPGPWPLPRRPMIYEELRTILIAEIPIPPAPRSPSRSLAESVNRDAAPLFEPRSVTAETGLENAVGSATPAIGGVEGGVDGASIGPAEQATLTPPPPVAAAPRAPVKLHKGIVAPKKIVDAAPVYPALAQAAHVKGIVILEAVIDARGSVTDVHVLRSVPMLDQAAIDAVRRWRYTPALLNDRPVAVIITVTVNFSM
jgi:periplasmic protein TonB